MKNKVLFILFWLCCSIETAGTFFADMQGRFPSIAAESYRQDMGAAWMFGLALGPFGSFVTMFLSGFWQYGWRLR